MTPEQVATTFVCGADPDRHLDAVREYVAAGFDEIYVGQIGSDHEAFFELYGTAIVPEARSW